MGQNENYDICLNTPFYQEECVELQMKLAECILNI